LIIQNSVLTARNIVAGDHNRIADAYIEQQTIIQRSSGGDPAELRLAYLNRVLE
jgi:hypothetical protein